MLKLRLSVFMKIRGDTLEKLKVIELFAGVGSQRMALRNIGVEHEVVGISEFDKFAEKSYMAIHGDTINFGDITKIESLPTCDTNIGARKRIS